MRTLQPERVLYGTHLLFDVTEEQLRAGHAALPADSVRALALASIRLDRGDAADALEILGDALSASGDEPGLHVLRGVALSQTA